jgi:hypothetical protein
VSSCFSFVFPYYPTSFPPSPSLSLTFLVFSHLFYLFYFFAPLNAPIRAIVSSDSERALDKHSGAYGSESELSVRLYHFVCVFRLLLHAWCLSWLAVCWEAYVIELSGAETDTSHRRRVVSSPAYSIAGTGWIELVFLVPSKAYRLPSLGFV